MRGQRSTRPATAALTPTAVAPTPNALVANSRPSPGSGFGRVSLRRGSTLPLARQRFSASSTSRDKSRSEIWSLLSVTTIRDSGRFTLTDLTPERARTVSTTKRPSSAPSGPSRPRTSTHSRPLPRPLCLVSVGAVSPSESALTPSRTGITAIDKPVEATVPNDPAALAAVCTLAPTSADVACKPSVTARSGKDARTNPKLLTRKNQRRVRDGVALDCRAAGRLAGVLRGLAELVDLAGAAFTDVTDAMCGPSLCELFSRRSNSAPPPTASNSGHSTSPATPIAPNVNAAAGVEWLPLSIPFCTPVAAPVTAPTTPLTAAPPTAPAAAVVTEAARLTVRLTLLTAPLTTPMMTP